MTKIIAEVGSNFNNLEQCIRSIELAKLAGSDVVKFQLFDDWTMYGYPTGDALDRFSIKRAWMVPLYNASQDAGIDLMCSFFSVKDVEQFSKYVVAHKVASSDMMNIPLIQAMAKTEKPLYISTGGQTLEDVMHLDSCLSNVPDVTYMYCESMYPCYSTNLVKLGVLKSIGRPVGLSDHSLEVSSIPTMAVQLWGATCIEKHVNLVGLTNRPDCTHALNMADFKTMVKDVRMIDAIIKNPKDHIDLGDLLSPGEHAMRTNHNRRLIATTPIKKGDTLKYGDNIGLYRYRGQVKNVEYLDYFDAVDIEGCVTWVDIPRGEPVKRQHLSEAI